MPASRLLIPLVFAFALGVAPGVTTGARAEILTTAKQALVYDYDASEILFCKDCDQPMPPSSMSKLMTVELVFQRLKDARLKPTDNFHVSETAWRQQDSLQPVRSRKILFFHRLRRRLRN